MDCLMDQQTNLMMYRQKEIFPGLYVHDFHTAVLVGIFTVNLADGWMDGTDDGHTDVEKSVFTIGLISCCVDQFNS